MTKLAPVRDLASWQVIIRAVWTTGQDQVDAMNELDRRGLWLSDAQRKQAGLPPVVKAADNVAE